MSEFPDPDFSFVDGPTGDQLRGHARDLDATAQRLDTLTAEIVNGAKGKSIDKAHGELVKTRQAFEAGAVNAHAGADAFDDMKRAVTQWRPIAPTDAEIDAADAEVERAKERLKSAADTSGASAAEAELKAAIQKRKLLRQRRQAADEARDAALRRAEEKLKKLKGNGRESGDDYSTPGPPTDTPGKPSPTGKPAASPATRTAAGPAPGGTSPSLSGASNPAAADAINNLMTAARQPGQPVAFLQPQQVAPSPATPSPVAASPAARRLGDDKDRALSSRDLGLDSAPAVAPVTVPATAAPSPAATPTPVPAPATSGTSVNDLHTTTDVSGRSDAPRVRLSAATATNATGTAAGTNPVAARSMSPGMAPPFMGVPSSGGSRGKSDKKIVQHACSPEEAELQGMNTVNDAVRGGTILQRRYNDP